MLASLGGYDATAHSVPTAYPQIWAWRNWLLIRPTTPTLACARFFHFLRRLPQRSRRRRAPTSEPIGRGATPLPGRGGTPCRPYATDASERRPYQHHARLAFTLHKQKPAALLPRALFILCHCERRPAFTPQTCLCFLLRRHTQLIFTVDKSFPNRVIATSFRNRLEKAIGVKDNTAIHGRDTSYGVRR